MAVEPLWADFKANASHNKQIYITKVSGGDFRWSSTGDFVAITVKIM